MSRGICIVAVGGQHAVPPGEAAGGRGAGGIAIAIAIAVGVEGGGHALVDGAVAVVVFFIADLSGARIAGPIEVVAVRGVGHESCGLGAGLYLGLHTAKVVSVQVPVPGGGVLYVGVRIVDVSVAVVVEAVADLDAVVVDVLIVVVAVLAGREAVVVIVGEPHGAIAVVVGGVGAVGLGCIRVHVGIRVVAVP